MTTTSSIAAGYSSIFGLSGNLGLGTASLLGGDATNTNPNASSLLAAANSGSDDGALSTIAANSTSSGYDTTTLNALTEGKLTTSQHNVIEALGTAAGGTYSIPWGTNTEPTTVAQIRKLGWIQLVKPTYDPASHGVTSATYQLTTVGKAIFKRTDGKTATDKNSPGPTTLATYNAQNITSGQEAIIAALATTKSGTFNFSWDYGEEPGVLSGLRKNGWIALQQTNFNPATNQFGSATYKLTATGQDIYNVFSTDAASSSTAPTSVSVTA